MKIHENWCLKSRNGLHCFHILKPKVREDQPREEKCCWCGKIQGMYFITGSSAKSHGKEINLSELFNPINYSWGN
ncbi:MAG: hypothetical protein IMZ52_00055 [Actinobacteria bacterium]|nr:hypothetical protein [Actinomycetota bacterium]MBE3114803.1 hypothetical protein [Actinomycetota bacterium]